MKHFDYYYVTLKTLFHCHFFINDLLICGLNHVYMSDMFKLY